MNARAFCPPRAVSLQYHGVGLLLSFRESLRGFLPFSECPLAVAEVVECFRRVFHSLRPEALDVVVVGSVSSNVLLPDFPEDFARPEFAVTHAPFQEPRNISEVE